MSQTELLRFCKDYLPAHPELKQRIDARGDAEKLASGLARAGAEAGFDFSADEIRQVLRTPQSGELSDGHLEVVAGGRAGGDPVKYMVFKLTDVY